MNRFKEDIVTALPKLPSGAYHTIYLDPPWAEIGGGATYKRGADRHYTLMKQSALLSLAPEIQRISNERCHIYMWVTNNYLEDGLELVKAYGFEYRTMITWVKDRFGIGQYFRGQTEHCLFGVRGVLPYRVDEEGKRLQGRTVIDKERLEHSEKPIEMRQMIERVSYGPAIELFGRCVPENWDAIGNQLCLPHEEIPEL